MGKFQYKHYLLMSYLPVVAASNFLDRACALPYAMEPIKQEFHVKR